MGPVSYWLCRPEAETQTPPAPEDSAEEEGNHCAGSETPRGKPSQPLVLPEGARPLQGTSVPPLRSEARRGAPRAGPGRAAWASTWFQHPQASVSWPGKWGQRPPGTVSPACLHCPHCSWPRRGSPGPETLRGLPLPAASSPASTACCSLAGSGKLGNLSRGKQCQGQGRSPTFQGRECCNPGEPPSTGSCF